MRKKFNEEDYLWIEEKVLPILEEASLKFGISKNNVIEKLKKRHDLADNSNVIESYKEKVLKSSGKNDAEIAKEIGRTTTQVFNLRKLCNIRKVYKKVTKKDIEMLRDFRNLTTAEQAELIGADVGTISRLKMKYGIFSERKLARIAVEDFVRKNNIKSNKEIARRLNVPIYTVANAKIKVEKERLKNG